jgi:hypothetical protein
VIDDPGDLSEGLARELGFDPARAELGSVGVRAIAVGWATVDLDRATGELPANGDWTVDVGEPDALLGAAVRFVLPATTSTASLGPALLLLEPTTEGRLAGALAHRGEGPAVLYVSPVDGDLRSSLERLSSAGIRTRLGRGPFGDAALVLGRPAFGPLLVLVAVPSGT